jgi:CheY-like chemotaxis protein
MAHKVLIVDSDFVSRMNLIKMLMGAGYEVAVAEDALEVPHVIERESPDLVLIGNSMVRPTGMPLVSMLFASEATAELPVLVIANTPEGQLSADQSGARAVISGPATQAQVLTAVAAHIDSPGVMTQAPESLLNDPERVAAVTAVRARPIEQYRLDRFTQLVAKILDVPVSTITLIESDRQINVSQVGIEDPEGFPPEVPLEFSYCQYTITAHEPLKIDDAVRHPLLRSIPAVNGFGAVSYLGIPLITADDQAVGSLCAVDSRERQWTEREVSILNDLAAILADELDPARVSVGRHAA